MDRHIRFFLSDNDRLTEDLYPHSNASLCVKLLSQGLTRWIFGAQIDCDGTVYSPAREAARIQHYDHWRGRAEQATLDAFQGEPAANVTFLLDWNHTRDTSCVNSTRYWRPFFPQQAEALGLLDRKLLSTNAQSFILDVFDDAKAIGIMYDSRQRDRVRCLVITDGSIPRTGSARDRVPIRPNQLDWVLNDLPFLTYMLPPCMQHAIALSDLRAYEVIDFLHQHLVPNQDNFIILSGWIEQPAMAGGAANNLADLQGAVRQPGLADEAERLFSLEPPPLRPNYTVIDICHGAGICPNSVFQRKRMTDVVPHVHWIGFNWIDRFDVILGLDNLVYKAVSSGNSPRCYLSENWTTRFDTPGDKSPVSHVFLVDIAPDHDEPFDIIGSATL